MKSNTYIFKWSSKSESILLLPSALLGLWVSEGPFPDSQSISPSKFILYNTYYITLITLQGMHQALNYWKNILIYYVVPHFLALNILQESLNFL